MHALTAFKLDFLTHSSCSRLWYCTRMSVHAADFPRRSLHHHTIAACHTANPLPQCILSLCDVYPLSQCILSLCDVYPCTHRQADLQKLPEQRSTLSERERRALARQHQLASAKLVSCCLTCLLATWPVMFCLCIQAVLVSLALVLIYNAHAHRDTYTYTQTRARTCTPMPTYFSTYHTYT